MRIGRSIFQIFCYLFSDVVIKFFSVLKTLVKRRRQHHFDRSLVSSAWGYHICWGELEEKLEPDLDWTEPETTSAGGNPELQTEEKREGKLRIERKEKK